MYIDYSKQLLIVFKLGIEISTVIEIEEVFDEAEYVIASIKIWSDKRKKYISPSNRLNNYIEDVLDKYPSFVEDMENFASQCEQDRLECQGDYLYEQEKDRRMRS